MLKRNSLLVYLLALWMLAALGRAQSPPPSMVAEGVPPIPAELRERTNQYLNMRAAIFADWQPNQRAMLILTRFGDSNQVHLVEQPGGYRRQLTFLSDRILGADFAPGRNYFVFAMDTGGAEFYQYYRFDLADGSAHLLTDGKSRNTGWLFNHRGTLAAYMSTRRNGRDTDLYLLDPVNPSAEKRALELEGAWQPLDWSPDDRRLLLLHYISVNQSDVFAYDVPSGRLESLTPEGEGAVFYGPALWSRHSNGFYVISDRGSEFRKVFYYDLGTKKFVSYTDAIPWDIEEIDLAPDGRILAFSANVDGASEIHLLDIRTGRELPAPALSSKRTVHIGSGRVQPGEPHLPKGVVSRLKFHPLRNDLALTVNSATSPNDVYSYDLDSKKLERWTYSETGGLNAQNFQEAELVHYPAFDEVDGKRREIAALITRPPARFKPPYPVLMNIHGGPEGQTRPGFNARYNYFVNEMGIALVEPNVRGSTGYGKTFTDLDNGYQREDSVKDIGALLDWIARQPDLDAKRVAVMGGSYGGYMSLATLTHYGDRVRSGIDIVGVSNFVALLERTESYRRDLRRAEYGDERDPKMREFLESISPTHNAEKILVPLLVAAGKNDPRVPVSLSEEIVRKAKANELPVWYLVAKDEGHGYAKKHNSDYLQYAVALFLEQFLLK